MPKKTLQDFEFSAELLKECKAVSLPVMKYMLSSKQTGVFNLGKFAQQFLSECGGDKAIAEKGVRTAFKFLEKCGVASIGANLCSAKTLQPPAQDIDDVAKKLGELVGQTEDKIKQALQQPNRDTKDPWDMVSFNAAVSEALDA